MVFWVPCSGLKLKLSEVILRVSAVNLTDRALDIRRSRSDIEREQRQLMGHEIRRMGSGEDQPVGFSLDRRLDQSTACQSSTEM